MSGISTWSKALLAPRTWSFLAVLISALALVVAMAAFIRAGSTTTVQDATRPAALATTTQPTSVPTSDAPTETDSPSTDTETTTDDSDDPVITSLPSPGASYTVAKQDVHVRIPGGNERTLDLDEPIVNADSNQYDLEYVPGSAEPYLYFSSANVAIAKSADVTPDECGRAIQLAPSDRQVTVSQDLVVCAVTNGIGAVNEPSQAKMARIIVNSVSKDKSVDLTITTWVIPH